MKPPKGNFSNKKDFRKDFRNNRRKGNFNREKPVDEKKPVYLCEICGKDIQDISSAMSVQATGNPAHFDCVLKKISESEKIEEGQQLVYLGGGNFGIIKTEASSPKNGFKIIKKIEYEPKDNVPEWRKQLVKVKV